MNDLHIPKGKDSLVCPMRLLDTQRFPPCFEETVVPEAFKEWPSAPLGTQQG